MAYKAQNDLMCPIPSPATPLTYHASSTILSLNCPQVWKALVIYIHGWLLLVIHKKKSSLPIEYKAVLPHLPPTYFHFHSPCLIFFIEFIAI